MYNHQLDTFLQVVDSGSFGKAAEALYISAPAVIQQINLLEDRCGFQLLTRSNHGVRPTSAGRSLYEDAKTLIRLSDDALSRARLLADSSETTVRVGTSLLFKCRLLPDIWSKISAQCPDLKIELLPMPERQTREDGLTALGIQYDMREGIFCTISHAGRCGFLELTRTPVCCAVAKNHRLAGFQRLTMDDLNGEYLVMPIQNVSRELDAFREEITQRYPTVQIVDSSYYGVDTFTLCEMNPYVLITQPVYTDIHTNLVTIPLETDYTLPYGLIYAKEPSPAVKKFLHATKEQRNL